MNADLEAALVDYSHDPLGFVMWAFPWGEPGTELEKWEGPDVWQTTLLLSLGDGLLTVDEAVQLAVASGHGVGKSALVAWCIIWAISTCPDTKGVVTANTENQLKTKTWAELSKWFRFFIAKDLFKLTATAIFSRDPEHERTWRIDMVPWSEHNTEAFAGLHNEGSRILIVFDEGSGIPDAIYEVTEGALTDTNTEIIFLVFGNPTKNTGRFRELFPGGRFAHRWKSQTVDSREVKISNKKQIQKWLEDYGVDHDFFRIRVRGVFPRVDAMSFIPFDLATKAATATPKIDYGSPIVLGVDVARFGDNSSIIYPRKGLDARSRPITTIPNNSIPELVRAVSAAYAKFSASMVFVDEGGVGGGVVDMLNELRIPVIGVQFGAKPAGSNIYEPETLYANRRSELYGTLRAWLQAGGVIPMRVPTMETTFPEELATPAYGYSTQEAIQLESKRNMRRRCSVPLDVSDALAISLAIPDIIPSRPVTDIFRRDTPDEIPIHDPYSDERLRT